jgi:outer membrane lipoprotein-sorting protein
MRDGILRVGAVVSLILALGTVVFAQRPPQDTASMTDVQIVELAKRAYARCDSYRDSGVVITTFVSEESQWTAEKPFTTAFVRPDGFRLEFKDKSLGDPPPISIIWAAGDDVRTWSDLEPGVETPANLARALAAATGTSQGVSYRVPSMLLAGDAPTGKPPLDLNYAMRVGDEDEAGHGCFRIRGQSIRTPRTLGEGEQAVVLQENTVTIWIDKQSYLVRRVEETNVYETFRTDMVTTYSPEINVRIPSEELEFGAPQAN